MEKVKKMVEAGATISAAIKDALAQNGLRTVSDFAEKYGLRRASAANHINAVTRPDAATIDGLVAELGGTPDEWRELLWLAAKPEKASA